MRRRRPAIDTTTGGEGSVAPDLPASAPHAQRLREAFLAAVTEEDMRALAVDLLSSARGDLGANCDLGAARLLLEFVLGKSSAVKEAAMGGYRQLDRDRAPRPHGLTG